MWISHELPDSSLYLEWLQVNEEYVNVLQVLSKKLKYLSANSSFKDAAAMQDVIPEFERLRVKAVYKVHF